MTDPTETSAAEAAGRVQAWLASSAPAERDPFIETAVVRPGLNAGDPSLYRADLRALLAERERLLAPPALPAELPPGMDREFAKYDSCEDPGNCDHDHDAVFEYLNEAELAGLRAERAAAIARAEKAEAALREAGETPRPFLAKAIANIEPELRQQFETAWAKAMAEWDRRLVVLSPREELRQEWGYRWPDGEIEISDSETEARDYISSYDQAVLMRRLVGKWREVDDNTDSGSST